ncbi:MAG TPA: DUF998 domain-containing protein [Micromonospora sp.]
MAEPGVAPAVAVGRRVAAAGSALGTLAGAVAVTVAVVAGPGPGLTGYVSEAGIAGSRYATTYRWGILALAAGLLLLALALPRVLRYPAGLLGVAAVSTVVSGAVTCSAGCPLPPFEATTVADLVHGAASIAAAAACVFAMFLLTVSAHTPPALRRVSATATAVALPLALSVAVGMVTVGRGSLVGGLERLFLADAVLWVATGSVTLATGRDRITAADRFPAGL